MSNNDKDIYGHFYKERKEFEDERNDAVMEVTPRAVPLIEAIDDRGVALTSIDGETFTCYLIHGKWYYGGNAMAAYDGAGTKKIGKDTDAIKSYRVGKLPPAHIHARAKRYAVKLFLAHFHETGYRLHYGTEPPAPYPISAPRPRPPHPGRRTRS